MAHGDPGDLTFPLPRPVRILLGESSVPVDDSPRRRWDWVNLDWLGAVLGPAPL
ncbi:hypothetical protein [Nocardia sp. BMG51109]|uniref:hypothetical protein n=1 Tax=Nocardia sp. BMG51109 TaxID=1056816 RepID=UPI0004B82312|nr:hypothetical protein [Nocardia sp. BMG51109]